MHFYTFLQAKSILLRSDLDQEIEIFLAPYRGCAYWLILRDTRRTVKWVQGTNGESCCSSGRGCLQLEKQVANESRTPRRWRQMSGGGWGVRVRLWSRGDVVKADLPTICESFSTENSRKEAGMGDSQHVKVTRSEMEKDSRNMMGSCRCSNPLYRTSVGHFLINFFVFI